MPRGSHIAKPLGTGSGGSSIRFMPHDALACVADCLAQLLRRERFT